MLRASPPWRCPIFFCHDLAICGRTAQNRDSVPGIESEKANCLLHFEWIRLDIDEYMDILCKNKVELRNLKSADMWDIQINPKLGAKQVTQLIQLKIVKWSPFELIGQFRVTI